MARSLARRMVTQWGFRNETNTRDINDAPIAWESDDEIGSSVSGHTNTFIDNEIRALVQHAYDTCVDMITQNREALDTIAKELLEHETIDGDVVERTLKHNKSV